MRLQNQAHQTSLYRDGTQGGTTLERRTFDAVAETMGGLTTGHGTGHVRDRLRSRAFKASARAEGGRRARVEGRQLDVGEGEAGGREVHDPGGRGRGHRGRPADAPHGDDDGGCGGDVDGESDGDDGGGRGCAQTKFGESIANLLPVYLSEPSSVLKAKTVT